MALARGINKQLIIAREATFGTLAASSGGRVLRRLNGALSLTKDGIRSQEILPSQQFRDARHGVRRVVGSLSGQLSPGAYQDFFEGMLRRQFAVGATTGPLSTIGAAAGPPGTFTRTGGSFLADGFKVGDVVRWTGWATTGTDNNARNYRIVNLTATVMTVSGLGNEVVSTKAAGDTVTCAVVGKKTFIPVANQGRYSYSVEQYFGDSDVPISERFSGVRVQGARISLPPTGMVTADFQMMGQKMVEGTAPYFTAPTPPTTDNSLVAVNGAVRFNGVDVALITGAQLNISTSMDAQPVLGSDVVPDIFEGALSVEGQASVYVQDNSFQQLFLNEAEVDLHFYMTSDGTINSPFISIVLNRVKLFSATKSDSDRAIIQSIAFQALEHTTGAGAGTKFEQTTITMQDSSL